MKKKEAEARLGLGKKKVDAFPKRKGKKKGDVKKATPKVKKPEEPKLSKEEKNKRKRRGVIMELIDTEKNYLDKIKAMQDIVALPMVKEKVITQQQANILFSTCLKPIIDLSGFLHTDLSRAFETFDPDKVFFGSIFKTYSPFFMLYSDYVNNYERAETLRLKLAQSDKKFQ